MVLKIGTDIWVVDLDFNPMGLEDVAASDSRQLQNLWALEYASRYDDLFGGVDGLEGTVLAILDPLGVEPRSSLGGGIQDSCDNGVGQNSKVGSILDRMVVRSVGVTSGLARSINGRRTTVCTDRLAIERV